MIRRRLALEAAGGAFAIAFSAILFRLAAVSPSTGAFFRCALAVPALVLLARREPGRARRHRMLGIASGVLLGSELVLWHHAIDAIGAGLATVLANTQVVVVALLAWLLWDERPGRRTVAAIGVVFTGVVLVSGAVGSGVYGSRPVAGAVYGMLAGAGYAGSLLLLRRATPDPSRPAGPLLEVTATAAVAAAVIGVAAGDLDLAPGWSAFGWLLLMALTSQVVGWLLITISLSRLPAVVTSITLTLQPVCSVVLAAVILGERPSAWQVAGVAVILAGVVSVSARPGGAAARAARTIPARRRRGETPARPSSRPPRASAGS